VSRILLWCSVGLLLAALGVLVLPSVVPLLSADETKTEVAIREGKYYRMQDHFFRHGVEESGSINLVSAIYLGYRAFDTLGETIVLVLSVAGVLLVTGVKQ
jgi:multisubunit Na+/H+ antiporter MnhB subunit